MGDKECSWGVTTQVISLSPAPAPAPAPPPLPTRTPALFSLQGFLLDFTIHYISGVLVWKPVGEGNKMWNIFENIWIICLGLFIVCSNL